MEEDSYSYVVNKIVIDVLGGWSKQVELTMKKLVGAEAKNVLLTSVETQK